MFTKTHYNYQTQWVSLEEIFKYMTKFMISILVIKDKNTNSPKVITDESLKTIVV
jgi:hypothetical protein